MNNKSNRRLCYTRDGEDKNISLGSWIVVYKTWIWPWHNAYTSSLIPVRREHGKFLKTPPCTVRYYTSFASFFPLGYLLPFCMCVSALSHFSLFTHSLTSGVKTSVSYQYQQYVIKWISTYVWMSLTAEGKLLNMIIRGDFYRWWGWCVRTDIKYNLW